MSVPSACHAILPTLLLKLLLLRALFSHCSFLGVFPSPKLAHLPDFLSGHRLSPSLPSFHVLWARLCSRRWACNDKHVKEHPCPRGAEFQGEFLKLP